MRILAIETSCDETAAAIVDATGGIRKPQFKVIRNIVASQVLVHRPYGGVVPNLAKREHVKNLPIILGKIFKKQAINKRQLKMLRRSTLDISSIDLIAVTVGPGLEPALWAGIEFAKEFHKDLQQTTDNRQLSLVGVNHMEGHLYSFLLPQKTRPKISPAPKLRRAGKNQKLKTMLFPAVALVVSGGHTMLLKMRSLTGWKKLGETRDDAAGEAFDKVARMLELPYPGGPELEKLAKSGDPKAVSFPRPMIYRKNYDFSFSGLKTAVLYYLRNRRLTTDDVQRADIAASFQQAAIDVLVKKTMRAVHEFGAKSVILCGGVAANRALRRNLQLITNNLQLRFFVPAFSYNTDNAAMIAVAAYMNRLRKKRYRLEANGGLGL